MKFLRNFTEVRGPKTDTKGKHYGRQFTVLDLCALVNMLGSHICYGKYLYFWAETNLVNSELCGMLNAAQAAENLAQGW